MLHVAPRKWHRPKSAARCRRSCDRFHQAPRRLFPERRARRWRRVRLLKYPSASRRTHPSAYACRLAQKHHGSLLLIAFLRLKISVGSETKQASKRPDEGQFAGLSDDLQFFVALAFAQVEATNLSLFRLPLLGRGLGRGLETGRPTTSLFPGPSPKGRREIIKPTS